MSDEVRFRFEALSAAGWHVRRYLTKAQLEAARATAREDHLVRQYRWSEEPRDG